MFRQAVCFSSANRFQVRKGHHLQLGLRSWNHASSCSVLNGKRNFEQPQRRHFSSKSIKSYSDTEVHDGMDRWIQEFVMTHKICPYAKGSSYAIHVWTNEEMDGDEEESILGFCHQHLPLTTATPAISTYRPNIFLCFPNVPQFQDYLSFLGFYQALMHILPHVVGDNASSCTSITSDDLVWQSFVFHPLYVDMTTHEPNLRFRAPFPCLHCILLSDLEQQRQKPGRISKTINQRNVTTLQQPEVIAALQQIHWEARGKEN